MCVFVSKVVIKVIRNSHRYIEAAKTELRILQHITNADDGRSCCIHLQDHFHWNKHPILVFKLYGPSVYTVMAKNHYRPFPDYIVKPLTTQICTAIQCMFWLLAVMRSETDWSHIQDSLIYKGNKNIFHFRLVGLMPL